MATIPVSVRLRHVFESKHLRLCGDLHGLSFSGIRAYRNCGNKTLNELRERLRAIQHSHETPDKFGRRVFAMDQHALMVTPVAEFVRFELVFFGLGVVHVALAGAESSRALHDALLADKVGGLDGIGFRRRCHQKRGACWCIGYTRSARSRPSRKCLANAWPFFRFLAVVWSCNELHCVLSWDAECLDNIEDLQLGSTGDDQAKPSWAELQIDFWKVVTNPLIACQS